jgi:cytochrome o ubiquinol oxidase operon protein cyoD
MADHSHGADAHGHDSAAFHATTKDYVIGFLLSVVLTAIPFWLVMSGAIADKSTTGLIIMAFAAVQVVVHMIYFLHMNGKIEGGWNLMAALFTILLVAIILAGSAWVMFHLNYNMMSDMPKMDGMS